VFLTDMIRAVLQSRSWSWRCDDPSRSVKSVIRIS